MLVLHCVWVVGVGWLDETRKGLLLAEYLVRRIGTTAMVMNN